MSAQPWPQRSPGRNGSWRVKVPGHPMAVDRDWAPEHRWVAYEHYGPFESWMQVHHINHDPGDNRPENLVVLPPTEHQAIHSEERRKIDVVVAAEMYERGCSTVEIAERFDTYPGNVSRALRSVGVTMRDSGVGRRVVGPTEAEIRDAHTRSKSAVEVAKRLGVPIMSARRMMRELGLPSFPVGRRKGWHAEEPCSGCGHMKSDHGFINPGCAWGPFGMGCPCGAFEEAA